MGEDGNSRFLSALRVMVCVECKRTSDQAWTRWRAYRCDDPELDEPPALAFYCPACAGPSSGGAGEQ
jgi:hypothetical protein